jgi:hypothetical protein
LPEVRGPPWIADDPGSEESAPPATSELIGLIRLECQRGSLGIVQITSGHEDGYVYFRDGQVVHAATERQTGEAALREMLGWPDVACDVCTGVWPERESITLPWQRLLETTPASPAREEPFGRVVFSPDGRVVEGDPDSDLPVSAAHAFRLASAIGDLLALDRFSALEISSDRRNVLIGWASDGKNVLAARGAPRADELETVRKEIEP